MRILVLSDSHSGLSFMNRCVEAVEPDAMVHLGDYYDDGETLHEEYPDIPLTQVPGNCDRYRAPLHAREIVIDRICGVDLYLTHGHLHKVKQTTTRLIADAKAAKVQAVLYGHTHVAECYQDESGLWVMNPGSCGYFGGSAGLIEVENRKIVSCRIIRQSELEEGL